MTPGSSRWTKAPRERRSRAPSGRICRAFSCIPVLRIRVGGQRRPAHHELTLHDGELSAPPEHSKMVAPGGGMRIAGQDQHETVALVLGGEPEAVGRSVAAVSKDDPFADGRR